MQAEAEIDHPWQGILLGLDSPPVIHFASFSVTYPRRIGTTAAWLDRILANRIPTSTGGITLCHLLTERGTVRCEFTVTRLDEDLFYLLGTPRGERHDFDVLWRSLPADGTVRLHNATLERGCWTVVGPKARELLHGPGHRGVAPV